MKLLPLQWAAIALITLNAIVVATTLTGVAVLADWWNFVLVLASAALLVVLLVQSGGKLRVDGLKTAFRFLRESLPAWAIGLAALAFYGGWLIGLITMFSDSPAGNLKYENGQYTTTQRKVVTVLTQEQYDAARAANQRVFSSIGLALAGGVLGFSAVARRIRETS